MPLFRTKRTLWRIVQRYPTESMKTCNKNITCLKHIYCFYKELQTLVAKMKGQNLLYSIAFTNITAFTIHSTPLLFLVTHNLPPAASGIRQPGQPSHSKQARCCNTCTYKSTNQQSFGYSRYTIGSETNWYRLTVCAFRLALAPIRSSTAGKWPLKQACLSEVSPYTDECCYMRSQW